MVFIAIISVDADRDGDFECAHEINTYDLIPMIPEDITQIYLKKHRLITLTNTSFIRCPKMKVGLSSNF